MSVLSKGKPGYHSDGLDLLVFLPLYFPSLLFFPLREHEHVLLISVGHFQIIFI